MPNTVLDDDRIGVPAAGPALAVPPPPPLPPASDAEPQLREGETDLGRPPQIPVDSRPLTDADLRQLREADEQQALRDLAEAEELLVSDPSIRWIGWFAHPLAAAFLVGSAGLLGLFLYSQILGILANLAAQPVWAQYLGYAGIALCGGAVLYAMVRLLFLFVKLQRNRQLRLKGLEELNKRTRLRWLAHAKTAEAKTRLEEYLTTYPIRTEKERKKLAAVGVTPEIAVQLAKVRDDLLDPAKFSSSNEWFERFRTGFQAKLDEAADARIRYWAKRTGMVTALAPNAMIDSAASLYFGFTMLADLCQVYNLRTGTTGTAVLLGRVFFNSYLAGQLNEWEKLTEEQLNQLVSPNGPLYELTAARVLSKVGAKAASGLLNYFLLQRLGRFACRLLRPVG